MISRLMRVAKHSVLRSATAVGFERVLRDSDWRQRRLLILCYHGVSLADEHLWSDLYVTADHLAARFELLRESGCNVVSLDEGVRQLKEGTLPPRSVAVTFDDGFADYYLKGYPILRQFEVPSVVYLTTYYTTDQKPVFDPLASYLLWKGQGRSIEIDGLFGGAIEIPWALHARGELHRRILAHGREVGWSAEEKDALASSIAEQIGFDMDAFRAKRCFYLMSEEEIRALDPGLVDVQLHTHRHRTPRDKTLFVREVTDNRHAIQELLPDRPDPVHFCYPMGDYDAAFLPWLREEGVVSATTCDTGLASPEDDPLLLPRLIDTMHLPDFVFKSWLSGTASLLPRRSA